jgi:hypothetical protein
MPNYFDTCLAFLLSHYLPTYLPTYQPTTTHRLTCPPTYLSTYPITYVPTYLLPTSYPPTQLCTCPLTYPDTYLLPYQPIQLPTLLPTHPPTSPIFTNPPTSLSLFTFIPGYPPIFSPTYPTFLSFLPSRPLYTSAFRCDFKSDFILLNDVKVICVYYLSKLL